ncbi:MAG: hypothetical protein J7L42_07080, partial [Elusimicrobia bacterium]|nr:hypothetical protein [Elusimicrobiota bacterium]
PQNMNFDFFLKILNSINTKFAFIIGAVEQKDEKIKEEIESFSSRKNFCVRFVKFNDIKHSFVYLNILLDFANFKKEKIDYKIIRKELGIFK